MSLIKYLVKAMKITGRIANARPEIIDVFKEYKEGMKDNKLTYDELLGLFNSLKRAILKICPELEEYL